MKQILKTFAMSVAIIFGVLATPLNIDAEVEIEQLLKVNATAYCLYGNTASGVYVHEGICAGKREWFGKDIVMYQRLPDGSVGERIGVYECCDTGGYQVANGINVDVWCPDMESCQAFMDRVYEDGCGGKVYIQIIDGKRSDCGGKK